MSFTSAAHEDQFYDIGIAVSGSGLGGVYGAGVLDFILEALSEAERKRNCGDIQAPPWRVRLTDLVGTSSGGITSTMAVSMLGTQYQPLRADFNPDSDSPPYNNALYNTWVKSATVDTLFSVDDLPKGSRNVVRSIANANFTKKVAGNVLIPQTPARKLPDFANNLRFTLTHTNLDGVPYINTSMTESYGMLRKFITRQHTDHTTFLLTAAVGNNDTFSQSKQADPQSFPLNVCAPRSDEGWTRCTQCTIATSAYPVMFAPAVVENKRSFYETRLRSKPEWPESADGLDPDISSENIVRFNAVDGFLNKRPYDLVAKMMCQNRNKKELEKRPDSVWGSVLLVDLYSDRKQQSTLVDDEFPIWNLVARSLEAVESQASFKHEEMKKCISEKDLTAFMITPQIGEERIASYPRSNTAPLLDERIRCHDFMVGRRNAQQFLLQTFVLPQDVAARNTIFRGYERYIDGNGHVPIIPLCGSASNECIVPKWPTVDSAAGRHTKKVLRNRISRVVECLAQSNGLIKKNKWFDIRSHARNLGVSIGLGFAKRALNQRMEIYIDSAMKDFVDDKPTYCLP